MLHKITLVGAIDIFYFPNMNSTPILLDYFNGDCNRNLKRTLNVIFYTNYFCLSSSSAASDSSWCTKQLNPDPPNIPWKVIVLELSTKSCHAQSGDSAGRPQEKGG